MLERLKRWLSAATQPLPSLEAAVVHRTEPSEASSIRGSVLVIDVRSEREFRDCAVEGAINLPLMLLQHRIREVVSDPSTPMALYCASGARSGMACTVLRQLGYANVTNVGGLHAAAAKLQLGLRR